MIDLTGTKHAGCKPQFIQLSRAWYGDACLDRDNVADELSIGFYYPGDGTTGEFVIRWIKMDGRSVPRLHAFHDAWDALWNFREVLEALAKLDNHCPTPEQIVDVLLSCGVEDATPSVRR